MAQSWHNYECMEESLQLCIQYRVVTATVQYRVVTATVQYRVVTATVQMEHCALALHSNLIIKAEL